MTLPDISQWLHPEWCPHPRVRTLVTTRLGRHSPAPWHGFNLGMNCGDDAARVEQARRHVHKLLGTDHPPAWLDQVVAAGTAAAGPRYQLGAVGGGAQRRVHNFGWAPKASTFF